MQYTLSIEQKTKSASSQWCKKKLHSIIKYFYDRNCQKVGIEGELLHLIKNLYKKPRGNIILDEKILSAFLLRSGTRQEYPL